jgi:hypothetical protein
MALACSLACGHFSQDDQSWHARGLTTSHAASHTSSPHMLAELQASTPLHGCVGTACSCALDNILSSSHMQAQCTMIAHAHQGVCSPWQSNVHVGCVHIGHCISQVDPACGASLVLCVGTVCSGHRDALMLKAGGAQPACSSISDKAAEYQQSVQYEGSLNTYTQGAEHGGAASWALPLRQHSTRQQAAIRA